MFELCPRVVCADKETTFTLIDLSGEFKQGKVNVTIQSMERYNVPHTGRYRIDEQDRYKSFSFR